MVQPVGAARRGKTRDFPLVLSASSVLFRPQELAELREQLRDVMFFVEGRDKLSACADVSRQELEDSALVVKESPPQGASGRRRRNQAKRK